MYQGSYIWNIQIEHRGLVGIPKRSYFGALFCHFRFHFFLITNSIEDKHRVQRKAKQKQTIAVNKKRDFDQSLSDSINKSLTEHINLSSFHAILMLMNCFKT